jgi:hypothetical protein
MKMWPLLLIFLGLGICLFIVFIFGLVKAGRHSDREEERIVKIISQVHSGDIDTDTGNGQTQLASSSVSMPKAIVDR